jgi:hypothetical protein
MILYHSIQASERSRNSTVMMMTTRLHPFPCHGEVQYCLARFISFEGYSIIECEI